MAEKRMRCAIYTRKLIALSCMAPDII